MKGGETLELNSSIFGLLLTSSESQKGGHQCHTR